MSGDNAKLATLERGLEATNNQLVDFTNETRTNIENVFNKLDHISGSLANSKSINWQQIGVLITAMGLMASLIYFGFVAPLQKEQDYSANAQYEMQKAITELQINEAVQQNEMEWMLRTKCKFPKK